MVLIHLPSGVRYRVLQPPRWNAPGPSRGDMVNIQCKGWLDDNGQCGDAICDTSIMTFPVNHSHVISGLDAGVLTMRVGEQRRFYIPASLAYGEHGDGACVPPNCDVIFDVTLQDIGL